MSPRIEDGYLKVQMEFGEDMLWRLPDRHDRAAIRELSTEARAWVADRGATYGQEKAIHKALTEAGYYLTGPRR